MRLKELREEKNLTQSDIATAINTTRTNIGRWEKELNEPSANFIILLADFFECSTDYLLGRSDDFGNIAINRESPSVYLAPSEREVLADFRRLPEDLQRRAKAYMKKLVDILDEEPTTFPNEGHFKQNENA